MERSLVRPLAAAPADATGVVAVRAHALTLPAAFARRLAMAAALGAAIAVAGGLVAPERAWAGLLVAALHVLGLGLGGLFFVAIGYATGATWSVALRRVPEALTALIPLGGAAVAAVLLLHPALYPWASGATHLDGPALAFKAAWLSRPFFLLRAAVYIALWLAFARAIVSTSLRQDADGDAALTARNVRLSIGFLVCFALTVWLASYDWIMSLEPHWYSTIFGVYNFAGLFSSGLAGIIVLVVALQRLGPRQVGPLHGVVTDEHLHDLGKLLFGFSTFWMYIHFSQYMLIWYANIPEETVYFVTRLEGLWEPLFLLNVALNWVVPFAVLLARPRRGGGRRPRRPLARPLPDGHPARHRRDAAARCARAGTRAGACRRRPLARTAPPRASPGRSRGRPGAGGEPAPPPMSARGVKGGDNEWKVLEGRRGVPAPRYRVRPADVDRKEPHAGQRPRPYSADGMGVDGGVRHCLPAVAEARRRRATDAALLAVHGRAGGGHGRCDAARDRLLAAR